MEDQSKDFLEVYDSLPLDQRQQLMKHVIATLTGKPAPPLIFTQSATIYNGSDIDEKISRMATIVGVDPSRIDREEFMKTEVEMSESKTGINAIIGSMLDAEHTSGQRSKRDEIISAGKFLYTTGLGNQLSASEEPDFILHLPEGDIGLEHTRLEAEVDKAYLSELDKKYLKGAIVLVMVDRPGLTGLVNLTLDTDVRSFNGKSLRDFKAPEIRKQLNLIHQSIAAVILNQIDGNRAELPDYIKSISYQPSSEAFSLRCNQEYFSRNDFQDMLINSILKKERRLAAYKQNRELKKWWLLIVYSEQGFSSAFKVNDSSINMPISTSFDRIFVLNQFNLACHELQSKAPFLKYIATKQLSELHVK